MSDEYISKHDVLNLPQSIERNLRGEIVERSIDVKDIEALKSAEDVVRVVRCKDCTFYTSMRPDIKTGICDLNVHHMGDDGFCSYGERKGE